MNRTATVLGTSVLGVVATLFAVAPAPAAPKATSSVVGYTAAARPPVVRQATTTAGATTCVATSSVTCTNVPTSPGLTPGTIAAGTYQDDENSALQGWLVTETGNATLAALAKGYTCMDLHATAYAHGQRTYICIKRTA